MVTIMRFKVLTYGTPEYYQAVSLRENILRKPLGQVFSPQELEAESAHIHMGGYDNSRLLATAVLVPEGDVYKMQRVAVLPDFQGQGIGGELLKFCEAYVKDRGGKYIYCHARDSAVSFYEKNHYRSFGNYFDEDGIPHLKMSKDL